MHREHCICALVPRLATRSRVVLVIHRREARKPTNTGLLAAACLVNSEVVVRGAEPAAPLLLPAAARVLLLYPAADAVVLTPELGPATLVVPDGNWRQAAKVRKREPALANATCVTLPPGPPSEYRLRFEPQAAGLATLEAIARAMGILEGVEVQRAMELPFRALVERTLQTRGLRPAGARPAPDRSLASGAR